MRVSYRLGGSYLHNDTEKDNYYRILITNRKNMQNIIFNFTVPDLHLDLMVNKGKSDRPKYIYDLTDGKLHPYILLHRFTLFSCAIYNLV